MVTATLSRISALEGKTELQRRRVHGVWEVDGWMGDQKEENSRYRDVSGEAGTVLGSQRAFGVRLAPGPWHALSPHTAPPNIRLGGFRQRPSVHHQVEGGCTPLGQPECW